MKMLVLGGTLFLGRHIVDSALARHHQVTLFNRGKTNPDLFAGGEFSHVEKIQGDRKVSLEPLRGRQWDAVIDTSGYLPSTVRASAEFLRDAVEHYTFVSSISVYAEPHPPGLDEDAPLQPLPEGAAEEVTGETYGPFKALCEQVIEEVLPGRSLMVRAGLLVGPHDPTGRFTYWVHRIARGGEVLTPGEADRQVQFIDARDVADWIVQMAERRQAGVFNVTGPQDPLTMEGLLQAAQQALDSDAALTWVPTEFLLQQNVAPWSDLPLWLPAEWNGTMAVNIRRALATGLTTRPPAATIRDTREWTLRLASESERRAGIEPEREQELLRLWHQQSDSPR
jgi:2'-hydroxyisoflavone reductase